MLDFVSIGHKQNIAEFKGTFNIDKCVAAFSEHMELEQAKAFAEISAGMVKELRIRVDTTSHLVVGYTQIDTTAERTCRFENIKINPALNDSLFTFLSLPEEQFTDKTKTVKLSREESQALLGAPQ